MTPLQPSSKGDNIVALIIGPNISPRPMPIADIPIAKPRCRPLNHKPIVLVVLIGTINLTIPTRKTVKESVRKLLDRPLDAPVNPTKRHITLKKYFTRNRSLRIPPIRLTKTPARLAAPQTVPICTRLKSKSSDISLKRTGKQESGIVETKAPVTIASPKRYHR
jgi:hypothetical protein